ncbi:MAG TPA: transposase [Intrasporangium sp.]|nr:transposase [Intrasporangium sp.]
MLVSPVRGVDCPATYQQLLAWFHDNEACLDYLARLPWPDAFSCPACGHDLPPDADADETMVGGVSPGSGGGSGDKMPVMTAVERNGTRAGSGWASPRGRTQANWSTGQPGVMEPGSTVRTEGLRTLRRL